MATVNSRMQQRRRTAAQWASENPVLAAGEIGVESDELGVKVGDGTIPWTSQLYVSSYRGDMHVEGISSHLRVSRSQGFGGFDTPGLFLVGRDSRALAYPGIAVTITAGIFRGMFYGPSIIYDTFSGSSGGRSIEEGALLTNPAGVGKTVPHQTGFYAAPTIRADGAAVTWDRSSFRSSVAYDVVNAGTATVNHRGLEIRDAVGSGVTATTYRGIHCVDVTGSGTVTTQVMVDIDPLAKGSTNIGIRNASTEVATPSVQTLTAVGNTITPNAKVKRLNNTSGGSLTLTSNPHISDGQDGQILILFNSSANDVVLTDGNGVQLGAGTRTIGTRDTLMLMYSTDIGDWIELGFVNN